MKGVKGLVAACLVGLGLVVQPLEAKADMTRQELKYVLAAYSIAGDDWERYPASIKTSEFMLEYGKSYCDALDNGVSHSELMEIFQLAQLASDREGFLLANSYSAVTKTSAMYYLCPQHLSSFEQYLED